MRTDFGEMTLKLSKELEMQLDCDAKALGVWDHIENADYLSPKQNKCAKYMAKLLLCYSLHDPQTGYCQVIIFILCAAPGLLLTNCSLRE